MAIFRTRMGVFIQTSELRKIHEQTGIPHYPMTDVTTGQSPSYFR